MGECLPFPVHYNFSFLSHFNSTLINEREKKTSHNCERSGLGISCTHNTFVLGTLIGEVLPLEILSVKPVTAPMRPSVRVVGYWKMTSHETIIRCHNISDAFPPCLLLSSVIFRSKTNRCRIRELVPTSESFCPLLATRQYHYPNNKQLRWCSYISFMFIRDFFYAYVFWAPRINEWENS